MKVREVKINKDKLKLVIDGLFTSYGELMDLLSDNNIITCDEINYTGKNWILDSDTLKVYELSVKNTDQLNSDNTTTLHSIGTLRDVIDLEHNTDLYFLRWFFNVDSNDEAKEILFKRCPK